jgi:hypothetical protein
MAKDSVLNDQLPKLDAIAHHFGFEKDANWTEIGVKGPTLSNWRKGQKISVKYQVLLAGKLDMTTDQLVDLRIREFCELKGINWSPSLESERTLDLFFKRGDLATNDIQTMRRMARDYCLIYLGRDLSTDVEHLSVSQIRVGAFNVKRGACPIRQLNNVVTNTSPSGWVRVTNDRVVAILGYDQDYYSESIFLSQPLNDAGKLIFYGLYLDISNKQKQIFAARFLMFPTIESLRATSRITADDPVFGWCREFLKDGPIYPGKERLAIPTDPAIDDQIIRAVRQISDASEA